MTKPTNESLEKVYETYIDELTAFAAIAMDYNDTKRTYYLAEAAIRDKGLEGPNKEARESSLLLQMDKYLKARDKAEDVYNKARLSLDISKSMLSLERDKIRLLSTEEGKDKHD